MHSRQVRWGFGAASLFCLLAAIACAERPLPLSRALALGNGARAPFPSVAPPLRDRRSAGGAGEASGLRTRLLRAPCGRLRGPDPVDVVGPLAIGTCASPGAIRKFTLAHLNDLQERYSDRIDGVSRYAYIAGYLRAVRSENANTLVLDAGDDYEKGAIASLRSRGEATRQMIQALPIDVRTLGNHDFAFGERAVIADVTQSAHPVLAANLHSRDGGSNPFAGYVAFQVGCVRIGVVGLVTGNYGADDRPSAEPFAGVFEQDGHYAALLADEVARHRSEVDVFVALTHLGLATDIYLATTIRGIDVVVGGHSEDLLSAPGVVFRADGSRAYVLQAGHFGEHIGRADFAVDSRGTLAVERYRMVAIDRTLPVAMDVDALARELESAYAPDAHRSIARAQKPVSLLGMPELLWRAARETLAADAMVLGRDVFWAGLPAGEVTLQRLYESVLVQREPAGTPGFTSLQVGQISGKELAHLRRRVNVLAYAYYGPEPIDENATYRVALEKRAVSFPVLAFRGGLEVPPTALGGELIDVLEGYARSRTARSLTLD